MPCRLGECEGIGGEINEGVEGGSEKSSSMSRAVFDPETSLADEDVSVRQVHQYRLQRPCSLQRFIHSAFSARPDTASLERPGSTQEHTGHGREKCVGKAQVPCSAQGHPRAWVTKTFRRGKFQEPCSIQGSQRPVRPKQKRAGKSEERSRDDLQERNDGLTSCVSCVYSVCEVLSREAEGI